MDKAYVDLLTSLIEGVSQRIPTATERANIGAQQARTLMDLEKMDLQRQGQVSEQEHRKAMTEFSQFEKKANIAYRKEMLERTPEPTIIEKGSELADYLGGSKTDKMSQTEWVQAMDTYNKYGRKVEPGMFKHFLDPKYFKKNITNKAGESVINPDYIDFSKMTPMDANLLMEGLKSRFPMERIMKELEVKNTIEDANTFSFSAIVPSLYETKLGGYNESDILKLFSGQNTMYPNLASIDKIQMGVATYKRLHLKKDKRATAAVTSLQNMGNELLRDEFYGMLDLDEYTMARNQLSTIRTLYKTITGKQFKPTVKISKDVAKYYPEWEAHVKGAKASSGKATGVASKISANVSKTVTSKYDIDDPAQQWDELSDKAKEQNKTEWPVSSNRPKMPRMGRSHYFSAAKRARSRNTTVDSILLEAPFNYSPEQIEYLKMQFE